MSSDDTTLSAAYRAIGVTFKSLEATSRDIEGLLDEAREIARSSASVLLLGETGTGKNLIAQAIHNGSPRSGGPFVALNCAAMPESLLEAELFGADEGAYTGSSGTRKGRFELAHGGTLFLDEIGDLSAQAQAKILHAIEYKEFSRVGGQKTLSSDVRIVAATNAPLEERVSEGRFRSDLYFRLNEVVLHVPPLRQRQNDIPALINHFIDECNGKFGKRVKKTDKPALAILMQYHWPGNVRELRGVVKRGVARAKTDTLTLDDLQLKLSLVADEAGAKPGAPEDLSLESMERRHIERVLGFTGWVKAESARLLGITRPTLDRKIEQYGLKKPE